MMNLLECQRVSDSAYIKRKIQEKIDRAGVVLCLLSKDTHTSEWVNWELEYSFLKNKKVICMGFPDAPDKMILPFVAKNAGLGWYSWDLKFLENQLT